jgi:hypothetical protein
VFRFKSFSSTKNPALGNETPDIFTASTDTETQTEMKSTKDRSFEPDKKKKKAEQNHPFR